MGLLDSLKKAFRKLFDFLKKLLKWLGPLLIVALIIIAFYFPAAWAAIVEFASTAWATISTTVGGWLSSAWTFLSTGAGKLWTAAAKWLGDASFTDVLKLATGAAIILDPEGVGDGLGAIIGGVGEVIDDVLTGALGESWGWWIVGGVSAYFLLTSRSRRPEPVVMIAPSSGGSREEEDSLWA